MTPFRLSVDEREIDELNARLARTRFPDEPPLAPWSTGTSLAWMRELVQYWREGFSWAAQQEKINSFRQYRTSLGGVDLHFIHEPSPEPGAMPLLLLHGWPGSIVEFLDLIPLLRGPFSVVAPSLPGFTLSFRPGQARLGVEEMAEVLAELMQRLGYERFAAQGGDWGAFIASRLGAQYPQRLLGIHLNLLAVRRDPKIPAQNAEEAAYLAQLKGWLREETGYQWIQGTRPQTLGYALTDSPAGLAAWIGEKFRAWSDRPIDRDAMLANISLYWLSGAIGSSFWPYYARLHRGWPFDTVDVRTGYAEFPKEILRPPRSTASRMYTRLERWTVMERGGHFAALEEPQALAREVREFFGR